jgi:endonuclease G, mitochondrial
MLLRLLSAASVLILLMAVASAKEKEGPPPPPTPHPAPVTTDCSADIPYGAPGHVPGTIKVLCKSGYTVAYDTAFKDPRVVSYVLTGDDTFGCLARYKSFHVEHELAKGESGAETTYLNAEDIDLGHQMPAEDAATTIPRLYDTFSMVNVAPQISEFNRQGWESLEQDVRDWAWMRSKVVVYVGPIFSSNTPKMLKGAVAIPDKFFKIVIDPATKTTIAFIMPNVATPKGDMSPFIVPIAQVEQESGISFGVPDGTDKLAKPSMWQIDDHGWHQKHSTTCHTS